MNADRFTLYRATKVWVAAENASGWLFAPVKTNSLLEVGGRHVNQYSWVPFESYSRREQEECRATCPRTCWLELALLYPRLDRPTV